MRFDPDWSTAIATAVLILAAVNAFPVYQTLRQYYRAWVESHTEVTVACDCGREFKGFGPHPSRELAEHCMGEHFRGSPMYVPPERYGELIKGAVRRRV